MWNVDGYMKRLYGMLAIAPMLMLASCDMGERPVLGALAVDSVTCNAIYCHVDVVQGMPDDYYVFSYGTTQHGAEKSSADKVKGVYEASILRGVIIGLRANTTYYIRACAMNSSGRTYTSTISVQTLPRVPLLDDNDYPTIDYN